MTTTADLITRRTYTVKLPDGRSVNVQASSNDEAAKASRMFLALEDARKVIAKQNPDLRLPFGGPSLRPMIEARNSMANSMDWGFGPRIQGADAALHAWIKDVTHTGSGPGGRMPYSPTEAYDAARIAFNEHARRFGNDHPVLNTAATVAGGVMAPGSNAAGGFVARGGNAGARMARGALAGGAIGAASGAAGADPGQEGHDAMAGGGTGLVFGMAVPGGSAAATALARRYGAPVVNATVRAANRATGGKFLNPQITAAKRLGEALRADGLDAATVKQGVADWMHSGVTPRLMDVAGENTRALLRAAASKTGAGRNIAVKYAATNAGDLQGDAARLARNLTPGDARPANVVADELQTTQRTLANQQYAEPYQTPVQVTPELASALGDKPGQMAIRRALDTALARRDHAQADELRSLLQLGDVPELPRGLSASAASRIKDQIRNEMLANAPPISAGTLDRIKIEMGEMGQKAMDASSPRRGYGSGMFDRAHDVNATLDQVPELGPARATYKDMQAQRDALEHGQQGVAPGAFPEDFTPRMDELAGMSPKARDAAAVGYRSQVLGQIGAPAEGSTGLLNRLSSSDNQAAIQDSIFGQDIAERFRKGVGNRVEQLQNARYVSPKTGSQTETRATDSLAEINMPSMRGHHLISYMLDKIRRGATMTDEERHALVQLGQATGGLDSVLQHVAPPVTGGPPVLSSYAVPALAQLPIGR